MGYGQVNVKDTTQNDYVAEEVEIGNLLGKPIYRKLVIADGSYNAKVNTIDISSININELVGVHGTWKSADTTQSIIPFAFEADFVDVTFKGSENKLFLRTTISITHTYLWIEYTKK